MILFSGCQTIKKKSDEVAERENEKFGLFVGKSVTEMRIELGAPKEDYIGENGNETLVYKTKKYERLKDKQKHGSNRWTKQET